MQIFEGINFLEISNITEISENLNQKLTFSNENHWVDPAIFQKYKSENCYFKNFSLYGS